MNIEVVSGLRDYNSYARQMEDNSDQKFADTASFILPGRVGDIGCATGLWLKNASAIRSLYGSQFFGIEMANHFLKICNQRLYEGEFSSADISFIRLNALDGMVFPPNSMDTIHTSSLTHEIFSYASEKDVQKFMQAYPGESLFTAHRKVGSRQLRRFIADRYSELRPGGVWINRDVVGPEQGDESVYLALSQTDGSSEQIVRDCWTEERENLQSSLARLSTFHLFLRYAREYRIMEGHKTAYIIESLNNFSMIRLSLRDAWEFATKKDYTDNWLGEMRETFCFWSFSDWVQAVERCGFEVLRGSVSITNPWIVQKRFQNRLRLFHANRGKVEPMSYPATNMVLVMKKR